MNVPSLTSTGGGLLPSLAGRFCIGPAIETLSLPIPILNESLTGFHPVCRTVTFFTPAGPSPDGPRCAVACPRQHAESFNGVVGLRWR